MDPEERANAEDLLAMKWFQAHNIDNGIKDIFKDIFLANRLSVMAIATFG
jgi:hypothetical protein